MAVFFASLNSGSNANCYYTGNENSAILVDAGLSCRETEKRMKQLNLSMESVKALFISHEHNDHISGLAGLSRKYDIPVYITQRTYQGINMTVDPSLLRTFIHGKSLQVGDLIVLPFRKSHDANDPHSFMITTEGVNIGVITDIGYACKRVIKYFSKCHAVFLESNYCEQLLESGDYPHNLKRRISGDQGHLSNTQALELFMNYRSADLECLILSHLSKNNNHPSLVERLFQPHAGTTRIVVASRYEPTPLFSIDSRRKTFQPKEKPRKETQLSLF